MNKNQDFLNLLNNNKTVKKQNSTSKLSIEEAVELNKDKYFEDERKKTSAKPLISYTYSEDINCNFQAFGSFKTEGSVNKLVRLPVEIEKELNEFLGKKVMPKDIVMLAYLAMINLKEKGVKCKATYKNQ